MTFNNLPMTKTGVVVRMAMTTYRGMEITLH